ncbi:MAG: translin [Archaeoglobales archaeon]|nr:translin [Archaeoglobales archaeon]
MNLDDARKRLEELEIAREQLLKLTREIRINSTKAIAALHSNEKFEEYLEKAIELLREVGEYKKYPEIYFSLTHEAFQELVEAYTFCKVVKNEFSYEIELEVEPSAYLTGLADVVGELRRYTLNKLLEGNFSEAERLIDVMKDIYTQLLSFTALPDKLVPNLRPKLDVARSSIERTMSDYIAAKVARLHEDLGRD